MYNSISAGAKLSIPPARVHLATLKSYYTQVISTKNTRSLDPAFLHEITLVQDERVQQAQRGRGRLVGIRLHPQQPPRHHLQSLQLWGPRKQTATMSVTQIHLNTRADLNVSWNGIDIQRHFPNCSYAPSQPTFLLAVFIITYDLLPSPVFLQTQGGQHTSFLNHSYSRPEYKPHLCYNNHVHKDSNRKPWSTLNAC